MLSTWISNRDEWPLAGRWFFLCVLSSEHVTSRQSAHTPQVVPWSARGKKEHSIFRIDALLQLKMAFVVRSLFSRAFYVRIVRSDRAKKDSPSLWSSSRLLSTQHGDSSGPNKSAQCPFSPSKFSCFKCWSCDHVAHQYSFFCHHCNTVQPPCKHCNYFEYFNW